MIILIGGLPGSGKTFFAKLLAQHLQAQHINSDTIRKEVGKWHRYDPGSKAAVYQAMKEKMKAEAAPGKTVIVDSTFYKKEIRDGFFSAAAEIGEPVIYIEIKASEKTIRERISKPRADSQADFEVYKKLKEELEPVEEEHLVLQSDELSPQQMLQKTENYLRNFSPK